ncbi:MAG: hypothetical protein DHS20C13_26950 [Thermodesulfobacteriota bacterium]|nr:MAG: hypothetical protein DHS20C13_26950 [Thermodesulfobacteriota bacterium]
MKTYSYKLLSIFVILVSFFILSFSTISRAQYTCLPTCTENDSRFLTFGGQDLDTFVFDTLTFGIGSHSSATRLELGIFDGDSIGLWDGGTGDSFIFSLFADPNGDGTGTLLVGQWSSDGSIGNNIGNPMPDNDWFVINVTNIPEAISESGNYSYHMVVNNTNTTVQVINNYKVRSDGTLFLFPTDQPFGYEAGARGVDADFFIETLKIIYPNIDIDDPACVNGGQFCDFNQPGCCLNPTTYDGNFDFFFLVETPQPLLNLWDGDFDFGPKAPSEGPPFVDTDDPNTPPGIPVFADAPNTNEQTSAGTIPPDDNLQLGIPRRPPNVIYDLIAPDGTVYSNANPSATNEWELFQLNTEPGCAPDICDIEVESIPAGVWRMRIRGLDLANLNFIRSFEKILGVDEDDNPVLPEPQDPAPIPTMSEWGIFSIFILFGIVGVYFLRKKKTLRREI